MAQSEAQRKAMAEARAKDRAEAAAKRKADEKAANAAKAAELRAEAARHQRIIDDTAELGLTNATARRRREIEQLLAEADQLSPLPKPRKPRATPSPVDDPGGAAARRATERLGQPDPQALAPEKAAPVNGDIAARIIAAAESAIGVQYKWGGNSLAVGVDCSGLIQQAFRAAGIVLPRVSADQARQGMPVASITEAQPGDLLSWDNSSRNNGADHIALYIGNGQMIEAYKTGAPVRVVAVREGARINRVIGAVKPRQGVALPILGPNTDRTLANAVKAGSTLPAPPQAATSNASLGAPEGGLGDDLPPDASDAEVEAYILKNYPLVAGFLANPELKKVLFDAAKEGADATEIQERVRKTRYWAEQGESGSAFDLLIARGGPEAGRLVDQTKNLIGDLFSKFGLPLDDDTLGTVAKNAIRFGWVTLDGSLARPQELNDFVAMTARAKGGVPATGELAISADALGRIAKAYFVPLNRADLEEWTLKILEGKATEDTFTKYVSDLAKGRFINDANVIAAIDKGLAPETYFKPVRNTVADILELNPEDVDLFGNTKFAGLTQFYDEKNKVTRSRTLGEAAQWARDQDEFKNTRAYKETDASFASNIANLFGKAMI